MFQVIQTPIGDVDETRLRNWLKSEGAIVARRVALDKITTLESQACEAEIKRQEGFEKYAQVAAAHWKDIFELRYFLSTLDKLSNQSEAFTTVTLQK